MDVDWQFDLLLIFIFLLFNAFFSASEAGFFQVDKKRIKDHFSSNPLVLRYLSAVLDDNKKLFKVISIAKTILITSASVFGMILSLKISEASNLSAGLSFILVLLFLTIIFILFGEFLPKVLAAKNPFAVVKKTAIPFYWISIFINPFAEILNEINTSAISKIKFPKLKSEKASEEIFELNGLKRTNGEALNKEQGLIDSIVSFRSVTVHEVMTPRVDIVAIPTDTTFKEILRTITTSGHSRLPLFRENLDDIVGIIYAKDLLPYMKNDEPKNHINLSKLSRKAMFVPKTKMINDLLNDFQDKKMHIAIVVDEFGGTAGLISLEDIIEEIIGEIRDEYDKEENPVTKVDDNNFIVLGKLSIDELNELLNTNINSENEDFETLAGLVLNTAGQIPKEGYNFQLENYKFTIKEILNKRIKKVHVEKLQGE